MQKLQTDMEFMSLSVPYSEKELEELEKSLLQKGCVEPIITWHGFILDGHKRYSICVSHNIDYKVIETDYSSKNAAVISVCRERLKSVKPTAPIRKYLIGTLYHTLAHINKQSRLEYRSELSDSIADELGIKYMTVIRYGLYTNGLKRILEYDPELFDLIIKGNIPINRDEMIEMTKYKDQTFNRICRKYMKRDDVRLRACTTRAKKKRPAANDGNDNDPLLVGVKEMPVSDPDRELRGLTLTIPMWISAISRAMKHTDISKSTDTAKKQLTTALAKLDEQLRITLEVLK